MNHLELSEYFLDHLVTKFEHWCFDRGELDVKIDEFVTWCRVEENKAMNAKRSPDNKSYIERFS